MRLDAKPCGRREPSAGFLLRSASPSGFRATGGTLPKQMQWVTIPMRGNEKIEPTIRKPGSEVTIPMRGNEKYQVDCLYGRIPQVTIPMRGNEFTAPACTLSTMPWGYDPHEG